MASSNGEDVSDNDSEAGDSDKNDQVGVTPESPKLDDAEVAFEREASLERTHLANSQFEIMSNVWANMQMKVISNQDHRPQPQTPVVVPAAAGRGERAAQAAAERHRQGQVVADELARREWKAHGFAMRRHAVLADHEQRQAEVASALDAEDARCVERRQAMQTEQKRKTFIKQQQRSEQQKALKELQREQQRIYDDYYKKHHAALTASRDSLLSASTTSLLQPSEASRSTMRGSRSLGGSKSLGGSRSLGSLGADASPSATAASSSTSLVGDASGDFYMETLRNHATYAEKLEGAMQLVAENERRNEAHWRKVLLRTGGRRDDPHLVERARGTLLKRSSKEGVLSKSRSQTVLSDSHSGDTRLPDLQAIRNGGSTPPASPGRPQRRRRDDLLMPCFRRRRGDTYGSEGEASGCWHPSETDELEYAARIGSWESKVADHRHRTRSWNKDKASKAKSAGLLWEQRDREAKLRRAQAANASVDPTLLNKTEENSRRAEAGREALFNERVEKFAPKWEAGANNKHNAEAMAKQAEHEKWLKQMNAEDIVTSNVKKKLGEWQVSAGTSEHAEIAANKVAIKEQLDRETRRKARSDIQTKDSKLERSITLSKTSTLQKEKRNKASLGKLTRVISTASVNDLLEPMPPTLPPDEMAIVPRAKVKRAVDGSESDSSAEHEFLDELNGQCSQWLVETRKQQDIITS